MERTERKPYPSDLNDAQWQILEPLISPAKPGGRPREVDIREILNGYTFALNKTNYGLDGISRGIMLIVY
jgi:transposase